MSLLRDWTARTNDTDTFDADINSGQRVAPTIHVVGLSVLFLVPGLLVALAIEWASPTSHDESALLLAIAIALVAGLVCWVPTTVGDQIANREVFSAVAFSWIACSIVGAVPYAAGSMFSWAQFDYALFEAVSGFSSTGSTVLADIERNGAGILMWRQITQFYGGMGMVVLAVTVLPLLGVGGLSLMSAEAPGPASERLAPRVSETARTLWLLYVGITLLLTLALWAAPGPSLYDAFAHALTTSSTGGFSTFNSSVGHFDSWLVETIIAVGLFLCAMNFTLHFRALRGDLTGYRRSSDARLFALVVFGAIVIATLVNWLGTVRDTAGTALEVGLTDAFRDSTFNVVTLASSGGFGNAQGADSLGNFVLWNPGLQVLLLAIMIIGGSVGSTAGGIKVFRIQIAFKHAVRAVRRIRHPSGIMPIKLGRDPVADEVANRVIGFVTMFLMVTLAGTLIVTATGASIVDALTASVSAMSNMGPALGSAGPTSNFLVFDRFARMVIAAMMIIGRLEIFAVFLMFATPWASVRDRRAQHLAAMTRTKSA